MTRRWPSSCAGIRQFGSAHDGWGTNYKITKVQAAVGLVQLRRLDEMTAQRVKAAKQRDELLRGIPELTLPYEPAGYGSYLLPVHDAGTARVGRGEARPSHADNE